MATQKVRPDPEALERQHRGQRRRVARKRAAVYALVVVLLIAGMAVAISTLGSDHVRPATSGPNPTLAPDETSQSLAIVDVGSGTATAFTAPAGASEFDVTLDGSMTTYVDLDANGNSQVFVMDTDGLNRRQVTFGESGNPRRLRWSPDGFAIAYERDTSDGSQIFIVALPIGESTRVTHEPRGAVDPGGWAPDGGSIVFSTLNTEGTHYTARSVNVNTGQSTEIVPDASAPTLSPDGAWIAFNSWLKPDPLVRLILAKSDGSERHVIARLNGDDGYQRWSPDSTQIAFIGTTDEDGPGTYVYDLATGEIRFVSAGAIESWIDNDHILVS